MLLLYTEYIHPHCNQKVKQSMADNQGQGGTVFYLAPDQTKNIPIKVVMPICTIEPLKI